MNLTRDHNKIALSCLIDITVSLDCPSFYAVPNNDLACMLCRWSLVEMNSITVADKQKGLLVSQVDTTARN